METPAFYLASATPLILWGIRMAFVRNPSAGWRLILDLLLLLVSVPVGIELIGWVLGFPANPGDHSPGLGFAFFQLLAIWALCALVWMIRLAIFALRKLA